MPVRAVWFDVGETLIDESREYGSWADWLGVPRHTFSAVFGAVIARGGDYREVFQYFRPGFDLEKERQARLDAGIGEYLNGHDLYPDARPCLHALGSAGYFVGVAGNQTARAGRFLRELNLPCDLLATSDEWGAAKPDTAFFDKLAAVSGSSTGMRLPTSATGSTTTSRPPRTQGCSPSGYGADPGGTSCGRETRLWSASSLRTRLPLQLRRLPISSLNSTQTG